MRICSDDENDDDSDDDIDGIESFARKRRKSEPERETDSSFGVERDIVPHVRLLRDALSHVEAGLDEESQFRSSSSSSSSSSSLSVRRLLILGAEILLKLSRVSPVLTPCSDAIPLRARASEMVDKVEQWDEKRRDESASTRRRGSWIDILLERRWWRVMYGLNHRRYQKLVKDHDAAHLIRDSKNTALFVAAPSLHVDRPGDESKIDAEALLLDDGTTTALPSEWDSCALSCLDDAVKFASPDIFDEAIIHREPSECANGITTILLLPPSASMRAEIVECVHGEEDNEEKTLFRAAEQDIKELEKKFPDMRSELGLENDSTERGKDHVCFYQQRFYRDAKRCDQSPFIVQLLFCNLCLVKDDVNAIFYIHGLEPVSMNLLMETPGLRIDRQRDESDDEESEEERQNDGIVWKEDYVNAEFKDDDLGFADLNLYDEEVFGHLFPSIESIF